MTALDASTFHTLRAANAARQAEWDKDDRITLAYRANEMAGEVGEALEKAVAVILMAAASGRASNIAKKLERERLNIRGSRATRTELADELADVVICADLIAAGEDIDLDAAVVAKFNATSEKVGLRTRLEEPTPETLAARLKAAEMERVALVALIDTPHNADWFEGVRIEAAHQIKRWGAANDAGKSPLDWFWLIGFLAQKAATSQQAGDTEKATHHTISTGAALLNWFRAINGINTDMRPGIDPVART